MKKIKFQAPTGMHDILPIDQKYFQQIYNVCENIASFYNFEKIETPILEETELFSKGTGVNTDIVQKQMYNLKTKGGDFLTLRPEFTPGIVRAYIEQGMQSLPQPVKLYSSGPLFRYESPQAGRYRQFHQFDLEVLGEESAIIDAQIIQIFFNILKELKLFSYRSSGRGLVVDINSIGDSQCLPYYKRLLINYFKSRGHALCVDCQRRIKENPLRILDCKEEKCQRVISQAPQTIDHLCEQCHQHFREVLEFLDEIDLPYRLNPHLVRGLDYYTRTVFEIFIETETKEQETVVSRGNALVGGGRYDTLVKFLGGKPAPAVGGSAGIERIVALMKVNPACFFKKTDPKVYLAQLGTLAKRKSLELLEELRKAKIQVSESFSRDSLSAQLSRANRIGVKYALILGQKEVLEKTIIVKNMQSGRQEIIKIDKMIKEIQKRLKK